MAIIVQFKKSRAEHLLECLTNGKPISPQSSKGWTGNDMLALAGAAFFGAMSQGPASFWNRDIPADTGPEDRKAQEEAFFQDLHAAIEFYGHLTMLVKDATYDQNCEPVVNAVVRQEGQVRRSVQPITGMKVSANSGQFPRN